MSRVLLAYNKLSSSTVEHVFEEIYAEHKRSPEDTESELVRLAKTIDVQSNLLALCSLLRLVQTLIDEQVVRRILSGFSKKTDLEKAKLFAHLYYAGITDDAFVKELVLGSVSKVLEVHTSPETLGCSGISPASPFFTILSVLQMCGSMLGKDVLLDIKNLAAEFMGPEAAYVIHFLHESATHLLASKNLFRDTLREETLSMQATIEKVVGKHSYKDTAVFSISKSAEEAAAARYGMNTDLKKRVFAVVVTSGNVSEAQAALYKESLKVAHFAEVFHILLRCCIEEKTFNAYYSSLAASLIFTASKNHTKTFIKYAYQSLEKCLPLAHKMKVKEIYNLGAYIAELLIQGAIRPSILASIPYLAKKEVLLARVSLKFIAEAYRAKRIRGIKKMKEKDHFRSFFHNVLVDGAYIPLEYRDTLDQIYSLMHKPSK